MILLMLVGYVFIIKIIVAVLYIRFEQTKENETKKEVGLAACAVCVHYSVRLIAH